MKKFFTFLFCCAVLFSIAACSDSDTNISPLEIRNHPVLFGSVAEAEEAWRNADKKTIILPSSYEKYNDSTLLVVEANTMSFNDAEKDIINKFEIYFKNKDIGLEKALAYAKEYFPYEEAEKNYTYSESEIYKCADGEKYYVIHYVLNEGSQGDGNIYVYLEEENNIVNYLVLGTSCPNWMNRSATDYSTETWNFRF